MKKLFTLFAVAAMAFASQANVLTLCDGTDYSEKVPVFGYMYDVELTTSQMIYPAEMLTDMVGATITQVKFYTDGLNFYDGQLALGMKCNAKDNFDDETMVLTSLGTFATPVQDEQELVFDLEEPFVYEGGNLLLDVCVYEAGQWGTTEFCGVNVNYNASISSYEDKYHDPVYEPIGFLPKVSFTYEPATTPEPPTPTESVILVIVDQDGLEHMFELAKGDNGDFTTTVAMTYVPYGQAYWDPNLTEEENEANRPIAPFYFIINDQRYGAEGMRPTVLGMALENPLDGEADGFYTVPVGYNYTLGVAVNNDEYYVYAAVANFTSVEDLNANKPVAGVRYFNMAGQEMAQPCGLTIQVTTYTDGTTSAVKVVK